VSHRNARTTFHGRLLIVQRHQDGWKQAQIAEAMGISRKCVHNWISRHAVEGEPGLRDRSSRPHSSARRTAPEVEQQVVAARRQHRRGQDWLGPELGISARTVGRILRRHGEPYLRDCDPMTGVLIKASKATAVRYERERPGELVHVDVKKLGRIPDGPVLEPHRDRSAGCGAASVSAGAVPAVRCAVRLPPRWCRGPSAGAGVAGV
jgi:DNA-binding XRE family transcriptional regulator